MMFSYILVYSIRRIGMFYIQEDKRTHWRAKVAIFRQSRVIMERNLSFGSSLSEIGILGIGKMPAKSR